jgi:leader peptidase (prepilin peptidase)/N-methyltransferase
MLGAFLGWQGILLTLLLGSFLGSIVGILAVSGGRARGQTKLPFGTFLAPAAVLVLFVGRPLIDWYLGLLTR